ncbi:MAG: 50S ribosomal protein L15 [bacterium]
MRLEDLKPSHQRPDRKRIGRGGKRGTYSGKGLKGQNSRAGTKFEPTVRYLFKRYPKLRGYRYQAAVNNVAIVNILSLEKKFNSNDIINPESLVRAKLVNKYNGKIPKVKILGTGALTKAFTLVRCSYSKSAEAKIIKAGGTVKIMPVFKIAVKPHKKIKSVKKAPVPETTAKKVVVKKSVAKKAVTKKNAVKSVTKNMTKKDPAKENVSHSSKKKK